MAPEFPPDVQNKLDRNRPPGPVGGIGGRASENATSARARASAMGTPMDTSEEEEDDEVKAQEAHPETTPEPASQACQRCRAPAPESHNFCAKCGADLMRGDFAARLGIKFSDTDVEDYIFKGFVARDLKIYGTHKITVKSSQPADTLEVDNHVMNGKWRKNKDNTDKVVSAIAEREQQMLGLTASMVLKLDGKSIGESFAERMTYLNERGSAFVDLVSKKAMWFNRALTNHLQKADAFEGS